MKISSNGLSFIKNEEGCKLKAYLDTSGVWTIGYGNTYYEDNTRVKKGDIITQSRAESLFTTILSSFEKNVLKVIKKPLNQNQFDALVSLSFNIGQTGFANSTLAKKININPLDSSIAFEFERWRFSAGKPLLLNRRKRESALYFSNDLSKKKKLQL